MEIEWFNLDRSWTRLYIRSSIWPTLKNHVCSIRRNGESIFVALLNGEIKKFDKNLKEKNSLKFKYAKINALAISKEYIYAAESQGFIIKISKDFQNSFVDKLNYDEDDKIISFRNKFYTSNKVFILP